jgi:ABC-2 type transport system ATP-binding protein
LEGEKNTIAGDLSQGMQKRLDIACSIIHNPRILIIDEPTSDLDPTLRKKIWHLIKELNTIKNKTIIVSSHIPEELLNICDKIFFLRNGKIRMIKKQIEDISELYGEI